MAFDAITVNDRSFERHRSSVESPLKNTSSVKVSDRRNHLSVFTRHPSSEELWNSYCTFLDLNLADFMDIQLGLFKENLPLLTGSKIGKKIIGQVLPQSLEEFRRSVPTTTYSDYAAMICSDSLRVTVLKKGAFMNYIREKQAQGADLAHLKPAHMNPTDSELNVLLDHPPVA
jgi:hypothetical protein